MGKKMYYSEEEAAEKLGVSTDELAAYVRDQKLQSFPDGARKMFKVADVDALAGGGAGEGAGEEVELAPAPPSAPEGDTVDLSEADTEKPATKEDTVITAEGISIFDDEDLEIETADPMAKTQIAPSVEDQVLLEGIGSGSGLLDLTRESDDTSLGAEVLEHIDMEGAVGSGIAEEAGVGSAPMPYVPQAEAMAPPTYVEPIDASAGLFTGVAVACAVMVVLLMAMTVAAMTGAVPRFFEVLQERMTLILACGAVMAIAFALVGYFVGKSIAQKQEAMRRVGG
jgi:hypothetical protein